MKKPDIINEEFNNELDLLINGKLHNKHVFKLGHPSSALLCAGIENLAIEMPASTLLIKSSNDYKSNHPFNLSDVKNLPIAIANPIAIFEAEFEHWRKVVLTDLKDKNGVNFICILDLFEKMAYGKKAIVVNSIISLYPKSSSIHIAKWFLGNNCKDIGKNLLLWVDKEKALRWNSDHSSYVNAVEFSSKRIANIIQNFQNPTQTEKKDLGNLNNTNMITLSNYFEKTKAVDFGKIKHTKKEALIEGHKFMKEYHDLYGEDNDINQAIDNHLRIINEALSIEKEKPVKPEPVKPGPVKKAKQSPKAKQPKEEKPAKQIKPKKSEKPKNQEKPIKGKYKVGDKINWIDNDGAHVTDTITAIQKASNGEIEYLTRDRKSNDVTYLEKSIDKGVNEKIYFINKPAPEGVNSMAPEIKFIKRYVKLHGQTVSADEIMPFLRSLQKAITEKTISSKSFYADEIEAIQNGLVKIINSGQKVKVDIDPKSLENYKSIIEGKIVRPSVLILKRAISLVGKPGKRDEAKKLLDRIKKSPVPDGDPLAKYVKQIEKEITSFINDKSATSFNPVKIDLQGILGLTGLQGIELPSPNFQPGQVVTSTELAFANFKTIPITGKWKDLIGQPGEPFKIMIYGKPGCGKSSLAINFGHYLAKEHAKSVLYVSDEERFSYTLTEKINRLNARHPNLMFAARLPESLMPYDIVVIDSVNSMGLKPEDLKELFLKYPKKSFIFVFQTTKDGQFKGRQDFEHDVDAVIHCENKTAFSEKNRFGGNKIVSIF